MADIRELTAADFDMEVLQADQPVLIDLWAPWCGPCHMVAPIVEKIAAKYAGKIKVTKLNVDEAPEIASRYGVRGIPMLFIFKDGEIVERAVGVQPEEELSAMVDRVLQPQ